MSTVPQLKNSADDEDFIQALEEVEGIDSDRDDAKEAHRAKMATFREAKKRKIKMLCTELGMDRDVFEAMLADRAEDRAYQAKKAERAQKMPDAKTEMFLDALGQYSWLPAPEGAEPETVAERAARERIEAIQRITDDEQVEGQAALDELAGEAVH
jgi:hypothetical protein